MCYSFIWFPSKAQQPAHSTTVPFQQRHSKQKKHIPYTSSVVIMSHLKGNLSMCRPCRHRKRVKVQLQLLSPRLMSVSSQLHAPDALPRGKSIQHSLNIAMCGPKIGLDEICLCRTPNPNSLDVQPVVQSLQTELPRVHHLLYGT